MTEFIRLFIKDTDSAESRQKAGVLSGITGLICNALLFVLKLTVGTVIGSVAVISDAFNNLSDMGSTLVTLFGIKFSGKRADRDHPFGHGRFEYISALIVSFIILSVGLELLKTSFSEVISPSSTGNASFLLIGLLALSLPVKLFMMALNFKLGKLTSSAPLTAAAVDSRNDCISTGAVILSALVDSLNVLPFKIDGFMGIAVSLLIMWSGFSVARDTVNLLLGSAPDRETVDKIRKLLLEAPEITGFHDLIIHDYGPGRIFASVHAEISENSDIVAVHEVIDEREKIIYRETGCEITVHMDPVSDSTPETVTIKQCISSFISDLPFSADFHDLRITRGKDNVNVIFDIVFPPEISKSVSEKTVTDLSNAVCALDKRYCTVIQVDTAYI